MDIKASTPEITVFGNQPSDQHYASTVMPTDVNSAGDNPYKQALRLFSSKDFRGALVILEAAIQNGEQSSDLYILKGRGLLHVDQVEQAIESFNKAIAINPNEADAYNNRALAWQSLEQADLAESDFKTAVQLNDSSSIVHYNYGVFLHLHDRYSEAIIQLEKAAKQNPTDSDIWFQLGVTYQRTREPDKAESAFTQVIDIEQGFDDQAYYLRGLSNMDQNQFAKAETDFNTAISKGYRNVDSLFYRGLARYKLARYDLARQDFTDALKYDPKHADALYMRGFTNARLGNQDGAKADVQKALSIDPPNDQSAAK